MASKPKRPPHPEIPLGTKCAVWWCTDYSHPHSRTWDGKSADGVREVLHVSDIGEITLHRDAETHSSSKLTPQLAVAWFNRHPLIPMPADVQRAATRNASLAEVPELWTGHLRRLRDAVDFATAPPEEILKRIGAILIAVVKAGAFKATALTSSVKSAGASGADPAAVATSFIKTAKKAGLRIDDGPNGMLLGTLVAAIDQMGKPAAPAPAAAPATPAKATRR
ncbi:MAG TPA: hypothetical protein VK986_04385 [Tepidisphaeraceae bacterium]|nr:hypothetical protein [Tepidisphaeraceae bacterium]